MQPHVDVPGEDIFRQTPDNVQLFVGFFLQELGVHLLPAVSLPLRLLLVDHSHCLPNLLQIVQLVSAPVNMTVICRSAFEHEQVTDSFDLEKFCDLKPVNN